MGAEEEHEFHDVVESVGERFQNHPLDLVNEDKLHPRLVDKFNEKLSTRDLPAHLNTEWRDWNIKWKKELWDEMDGKELGEVSRLRTEVCIQDKEEGINQKKNYFDIVLFDDAQEQLELLCKSRGPANWFSQENDVELVAEIKHSKTSDEKDFFKRQKGVADIRRLANFSGTDIERVFVFVNHYPINHYTDQNRSKDWWDNLEENLEDEPLDSPVIVYYIPRKYSTDFDLSIQKKFIKKIEDGIRLETFD
jgi:hypothetical protein